MVGSLKKKDTHTPPFNGNLHMLLNRCMSLPRWLTLGRQGEKGEGWGIVFSYYSLKLFHWLQRSKGAAGSPLIADQEHKTEKAKPQLLHL